MKNNIKKLLREEVSKQNLKYEFEHLDSYSGQNNYELGLYLNNEIIGTVEYTTYDGFITVSDILVRPEYRRKGYGSKMMKAIKENHPEFKYKPSFKTDLGAKFKHKDVDLYKEGQINESKSSIKQLLREGLLKEGASPILYHFTRLGALENILSNNSFYLTSNIGSPSDRLGGDEVYYMSFSRTKSNKQGYGARFISSGAVRIKVDGQKINQNYKVKPVDYWKYPKTPEFMMQQIGDEMEDRILSNDNEIPNANKYIISIDILLSKHDSVNQKIIDLAKDLSITLNFFNDRKDFAFGSLNKVIEPNIETETEEEHNEGSVKRLGVIFILGVLTYRNENKYKEVLNVIGDQWKESIDKYHNDLNEGLQYPSKLNDFALKLYRELDDSKKSSNKQVRYAIKELSIDMRKNGVKTIKEYLNYKLYVGKKTQEDFNKELNAKAMLFIDKTFKERIGDVNYPSYSKGNEKQYNSLMDYPPLKDFTYNSVNEIKKYVSDYLLSNDNMFKDYYELDSTVIKRLLNLTVKSEEVIKISDHFEDVTEYAVLWVLDYLLWGLNDFIRAEVKRIKEEDLKQWRNQ